MAINLKIEKGFIVCIINPIARTFISEKGFIGPNKPISNKRDFAINTFIIVYYLFIADDLGLLQRLNMRFIATKPTTACWSSPSPMMSSGYIGCSTPSMSFLVRDGIERNRVLWS